MNQELLKEIELSALKTYALSIGVDKVRVLVSQSKEALHKAISEHLEEIIDKNVGPSAEYKELCDFAISIDAFISHCQLNDNNCIVVAIKEKIISIHLNSLNYELNFLKYLNDIKKLNELLAEEYERSLQELRNITKEENEQTHAQGRKLGL